MIPEVRIDETVLRLIGEDDGRRVEIECRVRTGDSVAVVLSWAS